MGATGVHVDHEGATMVEGASTSPAPPPVVSRPCEDAILPKDFPRRSARHATAADGASSTDDDVLAKAMRRKAEMFASPAPGTSKSHKSFLSYSNSKLSSSLGAVGVRLGKNDREIQMSATALKHMEFDHLTVTPSASTKSVVAPLDDDSMYATSDG